jgi:hypothetical protein
MITTKAQDQFCKQNGLTREEGDALLAYATHRRVRDWQERYSDDERSEFFSKFRELGFVEIDVKNDRRWKISMAGINAASDIACGKESDKWTDFRRWEREGVGA